MIQRTGKMAMAEAKISTMCVATASQWLSHATRLRTEHPLIDRHEYEQDRQDDPEYVEAKANSPAWNRLYDSVTRMSVLPAGPPPVVRKMTTNKLKVQMMPSIVTATETDLSCGTVTFQNCWRRLAPSTRAASYRSWGMDCMPPRSATS